MAGPDGPAGNGLRLASQKFGNFSERLALTPRLSVSWAMGLDHIRSEIEHMRLQVGRQRREILLLQRAGISTTYAEALLQRMLDKIDSLCTERDRPKAELPRPKGRVLGGWKW
jgi:hypothetical protein